jgi:hypothetical protein
MKVISLALFAIVSGALALPANIEAKQALEGRQAVCGGLCTILTGCEMGCVCDFIVGVCLPATREANVAQEGKAAKSNETVKALEGKPASSKKSE